MKIFSQSSSDHGPAKHAGIPKSGEQTPNPYTNDLFVIAHPESGRILGNELIIYPETMKLK